MDLNALIMVHVSIYAGGVPVNEDSKFRTRFGCKSQAGRPKIISTIRLKESILYLLDISIAFSKKKRKKVCLLLRVVQL